MKKFITLLLSGILLTSCAQTGEIKIPTIDNTKEFTYPHYIKMFHDDNYDVTCWIFSAAYQGGISCIPDHELKIIQPTQK